MRGLATQRRDAKAIETLIQKRADAKAAKISPAQTPSGMSLLPWVFRLKITRRAQHGVWPRDRVYLQSSASLMGLPIQCLAKTA